MAWKNRVRVKHLQKYRVKILALVVVLCQPLLLTSCIKTTELKDKAIIQAIGIDRYDGSYNVIIQNFRAEGSGTIAFDPSKGNNIVVEEKGITIGQALKFMKIHHGKDLFMGDNSVIVIGRTTAEEGIMDVFNYFNANYECRPNVNVVMADGLASDIIKAQVMDGPTPAIVLERVLDQYKDTGIIDRVQLYTVLGQLKTEGAEMHMPVVSISMDVTQKPQFSIEKTAVFKGDKLAGELNRGQTRGMRWFNDDLEKTSVVVEDTDKSKFLIPVTKSKTKIKVDIKDNIPVVTVNTKVSGALREAIFPDRYSATVPDIDRAEILCSEKVKSEIFSTLSYSLREKKTDYMGVCKYIKKQYPDYWKENAQRWDEIMPQVIFDISVDTQIDRIGLDIKR